MLRKGFAGELRDGKGAPSRKVRLDRIRKRFKSRSRLRIAGIIEVDQDAIDESGGCGDESGDK